MPRPVPPVRFHLGGGNQGQDGLRVQTSSSPACLMVVCQAAGSGESSLEPMSAGNVAIMSAKRRGGVACRM